MSPDGVRIVHYWSHTYLIEQFGLSEPSGVGFLDPDWCWCLLMGGDRWTPANNQIIFRNGLRILGLSNNGVYAAMLNPIFGWIGKLTEKGGHRPEYPLQNDAHEMGLSSNWS